MTATTLQEWFCLKPGRDNFKLKVYEDRNFIFCHESQVSDEILRSIEMRFSANEPIKMIMYGDWGVGKTHTANHIRWWLEKNKDRFPARTVMVEIGDIEKKSRFDSLIRPFLDELGLEFLVELTHSYLKVTGNVVKALREDGVPEYIASIFGKFNLATPGMTPPQVVHDALNVLKGRKPSTSAISMGLGDQLYESREYYEVLLAIGIMHKKVHDHRIIFIADEAAKLEDVGNDEATLAHWVATNRAIFDDKNDTFGFIYTLSGRSTRSLPDALWHPQVQNRLGENAFELKTLAPNDVKSYLMKLKSELVNQQCVEDLVSRGQIDAAEYDWSVYPFTVSAFTYFIDYYQRNQENSKPRDISDKLNTVGFIALKLGKRLVTDDCLTKANM